QGFSLAALFAATNRLRLTAVAVTRPHALDQRNIGPDRRTAPDRSWLGPDRTGGTGRVCRPQRRRQIDAVSGDPGRTADRNRYRHAAPALARRQSCPGSPGRPG